MSILQSMLSSVEQADYPVQSRVHRLRSFPKDCFLKRDDELGFGVSGSKIRKYRTLIPALKQLGIERAIVIGGSHSNHVLGMSQFLIENGIEPILYLRGDSERELKGNLLLTRLLVSEASIRWISREEWPQVETLANQHKNESSIVIPEGAVISASVPGAASLALDIIRNEVQLNISFDNLFIDAGTGMTAAITLLAYALMKKSTKIYVIQMAGDIEEFSGMLAKCHDYVEDWLKQKIDMPTNYEVIVPSTAASFGSVNMSLFEEIKRIARQEGVLTDPIYSSKLLMTSKSVIEGNKLAGNHLIVHSGGGLSLNGYPAMLEKVIGKETYE